MLFLRDSLESRQTVSNLENASHTEDLNEESEMEETENVSDINKSNTIAKSIDVTPVKRKKVAQISYEEKLLKILEEKRDEDRKIDEDKFFLLSLLPAFQKFNEDQKFVARTEIMNVMRRVRLSGCTPQGSSEYQIANQWSGTNLQQNSTGQYFLNFLPEKQVCSPPSVTSPMTTQDSWDNGSEASSLFRL